MSAEGFGEQLSLWPVHPQPEADELLSSWIVRLAHGNGFKVHTFCRSFLSADFEWGAQDIDRSVDTQTLSVLAKRTGNDVSSLEKLTLRHHARESVEHVSQTASSAWITSLGRRGRLSSLPGQMFCPACFREDKEPYLRRNWRMGWATVCRRHRCILMDRCPTCTACLQPHRVDRMGKYTLDTMVSQALCAKCGMNLRRCPEIEAAAETAIQRQAYFEDVARESWATLPDLATVHAYPYFSGIRAIAQLLLKQKDVPGLRERPGGRPFEQLNVSNRHAVLGEVWQVMLSWPQGFIERCASYKAPYTALTQGKNRLPWWLQSVSERHLRRDTWKVAPEEADYIEALVIKVDGRFTQSGARRLTRRDLSGHKSSQALSLTQIDIEWFFASLDQQISQSSGVARRDLLRDKVMFLTAQVLKLSQDRLRHLRTDEISAFMYEDYDVDVLTVSASMRGLNAWLAWYLREVRPSFAKAAHVPWLFPQRWKQLPMSESLIWLRFTRALVAADLSKRIQSYGHWISASVDKTDE